VLTDAETKLLARLTHEARCVRCGFCCLKGTCSHGRASGPWVHDAVDGLSRGVCVHLEVSEDLGDGVFVYSCSIRDEIMEREKDSAFPMFGCECSSTVFNDKREAVKAAKKD